MRFTGYDLSSKRVTFEFTRAEVQTISNILELYEANSRNGDANRTNAFWEARESFAIAAGLLADNGALKLAQIDAIQEIARKRVAETDDADTREEQKIIEDL